MSKLLGYISLGCAKNLVDTEVMLGELQQDGYEITENLEEAELVVINTCTFIEKAKEESINTILEAAELKKFHECKGIIVAGCLSQQYQEELFREIPEIDALIGTGSWNRVLDAVRAIESGKRISIMDTMTNLYNERMPRMYTTPGHSAYVKISEGCNNGCTFCIIPRVRGAYRSRSIESILEEVRQLASMGVKEINLIAQDTTYYGADLNNGKPMLVELLRTLVKVEGIEWIRMLYLYPKHFTDELLDVIVEEPKICNYIDMPLQHINNTVLERMKRKDTKEEIIELLHKIRSRGEYVTLRTSLIVGFPGETEEQFQELCEFVKEIKFDHMGVFTYSKEDGTPAGMMDDQIPEELKEERYHQLMAIQAAVSEENNKNLEGTIHEGMIESLEEQADGSLLGVGRLKTQAPDVDGTMYLENCDKVEPGTIIPIKVVQGFAYDIVVEKV